jgi:hypothetical protein
LLIGNLIFRNQDFPLGEKVDDSWKRSGLEVVETHIADKLLISDVGFMLELNDELNDLLPPAHHLHLLLRKIEADVVINQLRLRAELRE